MTGCAALEWYPTGVAGAQASLAAEASASSSEPYSCSTSIVTAPGSCRASGSDRARARSVSGDVIRARPHTRQSRKPASIRVHVHATAKGGRAAVPLERYDDPAATQGGPGSIACTSAGRRSSVPCASRVSASAGAVCRNESVERASRALPRPGAAVPVRPKCRPRIGPCSRGHRHEDNGDPCYTPITMTLLRARPAGPLVSRSPDAGRARRLSHLARRPGEGRATQAPAQRPL